MMEHPSSELINRFRNPTTSLDKKIENDIQKNIESLPKKFLESKNLEEQVNKIINNPKYSSVNFVETKNNLDEEFITEELEVKSPLMISEGKIGLNEEELTKILKNYLVEENSVLIKDILDHVRLNTFNASGGAVGIKYQDPLGNRTNILKSVNDIIFTGSGVTLDRQGKNIVIDISTDVVVAGNPDNDFARESTVIDLANAVAQMGNMINDITGVIIPTFYELGIGGLTFGGGWQPNPSLKVSP